MRVEELTSVDHKTVEAIQRLMSQLSTSAPPVTVDVMTSVVSSPVNTVFVARDGDDIVGTLTLVVFPIPTGVRAWIEDVVVDESARGNGIGDDLIAAAVEKSQRLGARSIDLTSRPAREAAHRLYLKAGFIVRETNVYRFSIE
ncbi:MAG: GNAT family N-acetyltransferase [Acidobacteria bacterium]|nr:GNAT family N-acetyltransferase [Acidobacteriota bacterium]